MSNETPQLNVGAKLHYPGKLEEVVGPKLTYRQELFCQSYTQNPEVCLNGTWSYALAYGVDLESFDRKPTYADDKITILEDSPYKKAESVCSSRASQLLRIVKISQRVTQLFNEMLRDDVIDAELLKIIMHAPKPSDRVAAIKEYNALKQRITKKFDLTTKGESLNIEDRTKVDKAVDSVL